MSSPAGRTLAPGLNPAGSTTLPSASTRTSSCMNTVSAPSGIGAPVKIRTASPGLMDRTAEAPAGIRPVTGKCPFGIKRQIATAHGVAIDGGIGEGGQRQRGRNIARENSPIGFEQRHGLGLLHRRDPRGDDRDGLVDRHQRAAEGKAIVG